MVGPAVVHMGFLTGAFQLAAAVAILRAGVFEQRVRRAAAALLALNAGVSVATALGGGLGAGRIADRLFVGFDYPTAPVIVLLGVLLLPRRGSAWRRNLERALVVAAILGASAAAAMARPQETPLGVVYVTLGVSGSYAFILIVLARECMVRPSWPMYWLLGAFLLRASDVAVHYLHPIEEAGQVVFPLLLLIALGVTFAISFARRVPRQMRIAIVCLALAGAILGLIARLTASQLAQFHESLITLTVGRPALMVVALCAVGVVRPFFRGTIMALGGYVLGLAISRGLALFPPELALFESVLCLTAAGVSVLVWWTFAMGREPSVLVPDEGRSDGERLLAFLARLDGEGGRGASRREIAAALGILPRNVQRVVDAVNRAEGVAPGDEIIRAAYARGPSNQLQYRYALTDAGRARVRSVPISTVRPRLKGP